MTVLGFLVDLLKYSRGFKSFSMYIGIIWLAKQTAVFVPVAVSTSKSYGIEPSKSKRRTLRLETELKFVQLQAD